MKKNNYVCACLWACVSREEKVEVEKIPHLGTKGAMDGDALLCRPCVVGSLCPIALRDATAQVHVREVLDMHPRTACWAADAPLLLSGDFARITLFKEVPGCLGNLLVILTNAQAARFVQGI